MSVVVLLDEVGLAEQSPHMPLKVLHKELEHSNISVVGISNWTLDPAKSDASGIRTRVVPTADISSHRSFCLQHVEPPPTTQVCLALADCVQILPMPVNRAVHLFRPAPTLADLSATAEGMVQNPNLKGYLFALSRSYGAVSERQECADFWGLREFYSIVRCAFSCLFLGTLPKWTAEVECRGDVQR